MTDVETRFHETWLGMVQPIDGLVVSVPVLVEAQCMERQAPAVQHRLLELCPLTGDTRRIRALAQLLDELLGLTPELFDAGPAIPDALSLWVPEGRQTLRPTLALRRRPESGAGEEPEAGEETPASRAGRGYVMLVWEIPDELSLDRPETVTGPWDYPPSAKLDRLLRQCRVPIGLLTNRRVVRLVYAPHGESSGSMTFNVDDMASTGGRPILDAFVMLLSATRFFAVAPEQQLPALLRRSRKHQAGVTNQLADQVFEALEILLLGFDAAADRDGRDLLRDALEQGDDYVYGGLLTVLLRLVFLLYAEDRGLLPVEAPIYDAYSVQGLFDQLQQDAAAHPDSMSRRFGAWGRLVALFRAVFLGVEHGDFVMPARRGELFDPHLYPFLEGWGPGGSAPISQAEERARVLVPSIDDETVFLVLKRLIFLDGQRLSYRALDVEQIGSVYEALMGYHVERLVSPGACLRPNRVWVTVEEVRAVAPGRLEAWLKEEAGLSGAQAKKLAEALRAARSDEAAIVEALESAAVRRERGRPGRLVLQPGAERRRTSSHYTPRSLTEPIVRRTLEPLIAAMGGEPRSEQLLDLVICDPAMGSGAFLVAACRFLADQVVAAWTREKKLELIADVHEDVVNHARRLVAQRCLYGVDKNRFAVNLAKLSLWLVTLAKEAPFTFVDHALRHGDSLVGLDFEQIKSFHWRPEAQLELCRKELENALDEAITLRRRILELAHDGSPRATEEKERLLWDAEDALERVRLIADLVVGAFFAKEKDKEREAERKRRLGLVERWLAGEDDLRGELDELRAELRARVPAFHWMAELPEVFYAGRADPLEKDRPNEAAFIDAIIGNPPFAGKNAIGEMAGGSYLDWLKVVHPASHGNADYSAHFFRRADVLVGRHGTIGLIATNTIAQGDTRATGLQYLVTHGHEIFAATRSMLWPGDAAVAVAVVHTAKGAPAAVAGERRLDGIPAPAINSRLRPKPERADPSVLAANAETSFQGSIVLGMGFTLTPEERDALIARDPRNAERIFPYLGGEEVNTSPTQSFHRYVINFGQMDLEEAERWPDLLEIVREKVKPERDTNKRDVRRKYWWRFGEVAPALYAAIGGLDRCLVCAIVSKHLMFSFQPTNRIFSHKLYVFPLQAWTQFALLQSRVHGPWAWLLSSTMKNDLNYSASDCFETFPFPARDPRAIIPALEGAGERLYTARARFMRETNQGLTDTYNLLKDSACNEPAIVALRELHLELDRAVLAAYGWPDVEVPAFTTPSTPEEAKALEAFQDEIVDRLFVLNAARAEEERLQAASAPPKNGPKRSGRGKKRAPVGQAELLPEDA